MTLHPLLLEEHCPLSLNLRRLEFQCLALLFHFEAVGPGTERDLENALIAQGALQVSLRVELGSD